MRPTKVFRRVGFGYCDVLYTLPFAGGADAVAAGEGPLRAREPDSPDSPKGRVILFTRCIATLKTNLVVRDFRRARQEECPTYFEKVIYPARRVRAIVILGCSM